MKSIFFTIFILIPFSVFSQTSDNKITDSIVIAFKSYNVHKARLLIDKLNTEELKNVFLFQLSYYTEGQQNDKFLNQENTLINERAKIINEYLLGDYYKNRESFKNKKILSDSLAYLYYRTAFLNAKRNNDTLLINEIIPRISKHFFDYKDTCLSKLKEHQKFYSKYAKDSIDYFWESYYQNVIFMADYEKNLKEELPKLNFNKTRSYTRKVPFLKAKIYQLEGVFNNYFNKNYKKAEFHFKEAIRLYKKGDFYLSDRGVYANRINLGNFYFNINEYEKTISICEDELKLNFNRDNSNYLKDELKICNLLLKSYKKLNNDSKALFYSERKERLNDLIGRYSNAYTYEITDYRLKIKGKETEIAKLEIRNNSLNKNLYTLFPILGLTTIILIFIFYLYKRYKKKSTILEEEQSETLQKLDELKSIVIKNHIILKDKTKIYISNLMYVKADDHYLEVITENDKKHTVRGKLSQIKQELPPNFIQCHRSYIVNSNFIKQVNSTTLTLINKEHIPLSRSYKNKF